MGLRAALITLVLIVLSGCGYRAVYGTQRPEKRLAVIVGGQRVPSPGAVEAALSGARAELSAAGVLGSGEGYPRLELDILRVDEVGIGIAATPAGTRRLPTARGSGVAVVVRGLVYDRPGIPARDSGDVRRAEYVAAGESIHVDSRTYDAAVRSAARRAGRAVARRVLGIPEPADEVP